MLIPLCGIFLVENLSVVQVSYLNTPRNALAKAEEYLMSPLHHHYQKKGYESKIVTRF
jgi:UDP-N-acetylmuramyl pentapeptide phosphotransferase/UDP-N-acetylglucosamine-1-phosphate transferase